MLTGNNKFDTDLYSEPYSHLLSVSNTRAGKGNECVKPISIAAKDAEATETNPGNVHAAAESFLRSENNENQNCEDCFLLEVPIRNSQFRRALRCKKTDFCANTRSSTTDENIYSEPYEMGNTDSTCGSGTFNIRTEGAESRSSVIDEREQHRPQYRKNNQDFIEAGIANREWQQRDLTQEKRSSEIKVGDYVDTKDTIFPGKFSPLIVEQKSEYSEPYETAHLIKGTRVQTQRPLSVGGGRKSSRPEDNIYDTAKPIVCDKQTVPGKAKVERSNSRESQKFRTKSESATPFLEQWTPLRVASSSSSSEVFCDETTLNSSRSKSLGSKHSLKFSVKPKKKMSGEGSSSMASKSQTYTSAYEDAWDTQQNLRKYNQMLSQAKQHFSSSSEGDVTAQNPKSEPEGVVYEDAWDSKAKQDSFEKKIGVLQKHSSDNTVSSSSDSALNSQQVGVTSGASSVYEEPWESGFSSVSSRIRAASVDTFRPTAKPRVQKQLSETKEPKLSHRQKSPTHLPEENKTSDVSINSTNAKKPLPSYRKSPANRPLPNPVACQANRSVHQIPENFAQNTDTYEAPWDSKEKERELQQKMQKARINSETSPQRPSPPLSPGLPVDFAPPPPNLEPSEQPKEFKCAGTMPIPSNSSRTTTIASSTLKVAEKINAMEPLDLQPFYHGKLTRKEAEDLMLIHREGSYLIRRSETQTNIFSLSIKGMRGMPMHIRISLSEGQYILGENSKPFPTVPEMVDYYTMNDLPVQNAGRLRLLYPIRRGTKC